MEIASRVNFTSSGGTTFINSTTIRPGFKYSNGYRIYASTPLTQCWKLGASLTHLPSKAVNTTINPTGIIPINTDLFPVLGLAAPTGINLNSLEYTWNLNLYYLDGFISRMFCPTSWITVEPQIGLRGFWMKQKIELGGSNATTTLTGLLRERYCGGGLVAGVNGSCHLGFGFSLSAKFGGSIVYSGLDNQYAVQNSETDTNVNEKSTYCKSHPSVDTFIGIRYLRAFCCLVMEAHMGWENHIFFHTNQYTLSSDGNLTLQGLTLGGSVRF